MFFLIVLWIAIVFRPFLGEQLCVDLVRCVFLTCCKDAGVM